MDSSVDHVYSESRNMILIQYIICFTEMFQLYTIEVLNQQSTVSIHSHYSCLLYPKGLFVIRLAIRGAVPKKLIFLVDMSAKGGRDPRPLRM